MDYIGVGEKAPSFCLQDKEEKQVCMEDFKNKWIVLYFYPKDNTSGCTLEAIDFSSKLNMFTKNNAVIIGVSPDSPNSHKKFVEKHELRVLLLSDPEKRVLKQYGVWQLKKLYGREYYGVVRTTYIIDPKGIVRHVFKRVRVKGHVEKVLSELRKLQEEQSKA